MNTKAYAEGQKAFGKGKKLADNPYPEYNEGWHQWHGGWTFEWGDIPLPEDVPFIPKTTKKETNELPKKRARCG